jgi:hypothetical protein
VSELSAEAVEALLAPPADDVLRIFRPKVKP